MINSFNNIVSAILMRGHDEALRSNSRVMQPEHVLLGILKTKDSDAYRMLKYLHAPLKEIESHIESKIQSFDQEESVKFNCEDSNKFAISPEIANILRDTLIEAEKHEAKIASSRYMLLAILKQGNNDFIDKMMREMNINYDKANSLVNNGNITMPEDGADFADDDSDMLDDDASKGGDDTGRSTSQRRNVANSAKNTPTIDKYSRDITKIAADGGLDPVVGREIQIERLAQILSRRKKNNPVLIGEPGVGKSAIIEGLALRIVERKVSSAL